MLGSLLTWKSIWHCLPQHFVTKTWTLWYQRGANEWYSSYLKNRAQLVSIGNVSSTIKKLLTGVPQGSVLDPLLFLLYINYLRNSVRYAKLYHFADETSVILSSTSLEILSKRINKDLINLSNWLKANKLSSKCKEDGASDI